MGTALNLDLQPPFYFLETGAGTKSAVQVMAFPPVRKGNFKGFVGSAKAAFQIGICGMALGNFVRDVISMWHLAWNPAMSIWLTMLGLSCRMVLSPNMVATVGAWMQIIFLGSNASDFDSDAQTFGTVFTGYAVFLAFSYGVLLLGVGIIVGLASIIYFWVAIPAACVIVAVGMGMGSFGAWLIQDRTDLTDKLVEDLNPSARGKNLAYYFICIMMLPLVQFLVLTFARLADGYGYWEAFYLTISERHITAYMGAVELSLTSAFLFVSVFL